MYIPRPFRVDDPSIVAEVVRQHPLALLIGVDGSEPIVAHAPCLLRDETIRFHLARSNPMSAWLLSEPRTLTAEWRGPSCYVSAALYGDPNANVPTYNYVSVIARGSVAEVSDPLLTMSALTEHPPAWTMEATSQRLLADLMKAIVVFELTSPSFEAKFKLSQNRSSEDRKRVQAGLAASVNTEANRVAEWMSRFHGE